MSRIRTNIQSAQNLDEKIRDTESRIESVKKEFKDVVEKLIYTKGYANEYNDKPSDYQYAFESEYNNLINERKTLNDRLLILKNELALLKKQLSERKGGKSKKRKTVRRKKNRSTKRRK
jgi:hypothetical protein